MTGTTTYLFIYGKYRVEKQLLPNGHFFHILKIIFWPHHWGKVVDYGGIPFTSAENNQSNEKRPFKHLIDISILVANCSLKKKLCLYLRYDPS